MTIPNPVQARKRARLRALQALYQHEFNPQSSRAVIDQFLATQDMEKTDVEYFSCLVKKIISSSAQYDDLLQPYLDIPLQKLDATERCILRIACYEFSEHLEIPFRIIINEAVSLAKKFGATDGHKYVNGVLDKAAKVLRPHE
ncbi:MAG: transcription antitermination factor NusB [Gammaproteobacteria bacterium]|nr:transcription antitermination factor NusB [Gammaproteobacteria bacterium]